MAFCIVLVNELLSDFSTIAIEGLYTEFVSTSWQTNKLLRECEWISVPKLCVETLHYVAYNFLTILVL